MGLNRGRVHSEENDEELIIQHGPEVGMEVHTSQKNALMSLFSRSPWSSVSSSPELSVIGSNVLIGSLVREEGHIYSLAAVGGLLYTGSDSKNIRVWEKQKEFPGFKAHSGLVKAIVIADDKIFTGHQDGKVRVWKISGKHEKLHKRIGSLPTFRDTIKSSIHPKNYVEVRRHRSALWIKHSDAISSLSLSEDGTLLYSASWDKTFKVWRISDSKCLESVIAHEDAVNSIVTGFDGLIFTGSADGTVKVWRQEAQEKGTKHLFQQTLLKQECAVTALAISRSAYSSFIYGGSSDGLVNFWEHEKSFSHGGVLRGHKLAVLCLTTAGKLVLSGSADLSICVWRRSFAGDHECLSMLTGHTGPVKCLAVKKDEDLPETAVEERWIVYSGSLDKSVKIWRVSEQAPAIENQQQFYTPNVGAKPNMLPSSVSFKDSFRHDSKSASRNSRGRFSTS